MHAQIRSSGTHRSGLSSLQEQRLRQQLRRSAPSEPWVDAQFKTFEDADERGEPVICRCHDPRAFPPGGKHTAMIRCPACGVWTPPNALEQDICLDHSDHEGWGPSPSAVAIRGLQYYHLRIEESELPPETITALKGEIRKIQKA